MIDMQRKASNMLQRSELDEDEIVKLEALKAATTGLQCIATGTEAADAAVTSASAALHNTRQKVMELCATRAAARAAARATAAGSGSLPDMLCKTGESRASEHRHAQSNDQAEGPELELFVLSGGSLEADGNYGNSENEDLGVQATAESSDQQATTQEDLDGFAQDERQDGEQQGAHTAQWVCG